MAQDQKPKPKPEPESEWEEIEDPDEWEEIPDPALTEEVGPPISVAPPEQPPPYTGPTDYWGGVKNSIFSGDVMRTMDQSAKGWMQGAVLDLPHGMWEGAKMLATTNPIGAAAYGLAGKELPVNEAAGGLVQLPKTLWEAGKVSATQPYEFGRLLGNVTGQPAMGEAAFGNIPGIPSAYQAGKYGVSAAGRPVAAAGRVMQNYSPFSEVITRGLAGTAGSSAFGPYGTAGALFVRPPKFLRGMESAVGRGIERGGEWMRDIDSSVTDKALEDFYGRNSPDAQDPIIRISSTRVGGARDPIMESPITTPDVEVPELRQFREGTNRNAWDPEETTVNETTDPILESPIQSISDAEALDPYKKWTSGPEYTPPPVTVNEAPLSPFDKYGMMDPETPEPGAPVVTPETPPPNVGTGSAFERAMQQKAAAERAAGRDPSIQGEEAPQVDITGRPVEKPLSFEAPQGLPPVAKGQQISVNPEGDIRWPGVPNAKVIAEVEAQGFKFEPETNTFRKKGLWEKFLSGEEGSFSHEELWNKLKQEYGRDPTPEEFEAAIRSMPKQGSEPSDISQLRQQSTMGGPVEGPMPEPSAGNTSIDPNEIWNNLWRLNEGKAPTEQQLMDSLNREGFKPGQRLEEVKNEIANMWPKEKPTWETTPMQDLLAKLREDANQSRSMNRSKLHEMNDITDELWDSLKEGDGPHVGKSRITMIDQFINNESDLHTLKSWRDDLGTMADNAVHPDQKAVFEQLYDLAEKRYRKIRNPGLENPRPNQSADIPLRFGYDISDTLKNSPEAFQKGTNPAFEQLKQKARELGIDPEEYPEPTMYENPLADAIKKAETDKFGPKAEIPPIDKWDVDTKKVYYDTPGDIDLLRREIANIEERLANPELKKDGTRKYSDKVYEQDRKQLAEAKKELAERLEREDQPFNPDTRPSNLPPGHVDIEGTRFIDLNQNIESTKPKLPDMVKYKSDWVNEVLSGLDKLRQSHDVGLDNALSRLKTDLKIKNPSRAQINEMISNLNKLAKHPDAPKDTWLDLKDSGGITEEDLNNYFKKKGGDEPPEGEKSKVWVPKKK